MMWTALAIRLFAVITVTITVTFKAVKLERRVTSPRSLPAQPVPGDFGAPLNIDWETGEAIQHIAHFQFPLLPRNDTRRRRKLRLLLALFKAPLSTKNRYPPTGWVITGCGR